MYMASSDFEKFKSFWEEEIAKMEDAVLSPDGARRIYLEFKIERTKLEILTRSGREDVWVELDNLENALVRVLEVAKTKYSLEKHGTWARVIGGLTSIFRK